MLAEPVTTLTDYAIALEATILAILLLRENSSQRSRFCWGIAFGWTAIAAATGGTCHGFAQILTLSQLNHLWMLMGYAIGCASFFMLLGTIFSTLTDWLRWLALGAAAAKLTLYVGQVGQYQEFAPMAIDYLSAMLIVLLQQLRQASDQPLSAVWIGAGIGLSLVAGGILAWQIAIAPLLNHNDLYHLVLMVSLYLLYRGARLLKDR